MGRTSTETLWRQWNLLRLIPRAPRQITTAAICEGLERQGLSIGRRTIERDLQSLSVRFPLVANESTRPFGWSWTREANFEFAPRLSIPQGIALLLAQSHLRTLLPRQVQNDLMPLFDLAQTELASGVWKDWHRRTAVIATSLPLLAPTVETQVMEDVHEALAMRKRLSASYRSKGAKEGRRAAMKLKVGSGWWLDSRRRRRNIFGRLPCHRIRR